MTDVQKNEKQPVTKDEHGTCGHFQSPIDIASFKSGCLLPVKFNYCSNFDVKVEVDKHQIKATPIVGEGDCNYLSVGPNIFHLVQFHFHTPAEHTFEKERPDAVIHMVHQLKGVNALAALSVNIEASNNSHQEIGEQALTYKASLACIAEEAKAINNGEKKEGLCANFDISQLLPHGSGDTGTKGEIMKYYSYDGGLTTHPYTENVQWIILASNLEVSNEIVTSFESITGDNAREIQPLGDREVSFCEGDYISFSG